MAVKTKRQLNEEIRVLKEQIKTMAINPPSDALLEDSAPLKAEIASLSDSLKAKDTEIEQVKAELADALSPAFLSNTLQNLTEEAYISLGEKLGYAPHPQPLPAGTVEDSTQDRAEAAHLAHNQEVVGSIPAPATIETAPVADSKPPVREPEFFIGKKEGNGWEYREFLGLSVKY